MSRRKRPVILLGEAGGVLTRNFVDALRLCGDKYNFVGVSSDPYELELSGIKRKYLVPRASDPKFIPFLKSVIRKHNPDLLHSQHDLVIKVISEHREDLGARCFLPSKETVKSCIDKYASSKIWSEAGIKVPKTILVNDFDDLKKAFRKLSRPIWVRANEGGGGYGALPTDSLEFAKNWINHFNGWGKFSAAEYIGKDSVTWSSIWYEGELIVAQSRKRLSWLFANRTLSGVTGVTGVGMTCSNEKAERCAEKAIRAIDNCPHGVFSVDLTLNGKGTPFPTEINIGRFFTTHNFFAHAGLNMPKIYVDLALDGKKPRLRKKLNPLPDGLLWIRGMDTVPKLVPLADIKRTEAGFERDYKKIRQD